MAKCGGPRKRPYTSLEKKNKAREWYLINKDKNTAYSREYYKNNKEDMKDNFRKRSYFHRHGITFEEAEQLLESQDNKCAICNNSIVFGGNIGAHIDHCHVTDKIRSILCHNCNKGLGHFKENITTLLNAINYLKKRKFILIISPFEEQVG